MKGTGSQRTSRSARRFTLAALLAVLAVGVWAAYAALAANAPPAPTITSSPANPTNQSSASFSFSDTQSGVTFQCSLDGAAFAACASPKSYSGLSAASHTFQVKALDNKSNASSPTSYTWTIDTTAPTVSSINRAGSSPTSAASVSWTVAFSESVKNVALANFSVVNGGLGGTPAITGFSGSGTTYTVTASTGTGSGTLGVNLSSKGTIADQAGNPLGGTVPVVGAVYTVDRTPPPAPTITSGPSGAVNQSSATFGFSDTESGVTYLCKLDAAAYAACANPATFSGLADGAHTLIVEAVDAAGNVSSPSAQRSWSVDTTAPPRPTVTGPNSKSDTTAATFTFSDTEAGVTFQCSMDNPATGWSACTSPKSYYGLAAGTHEFDVRAVDAAGNIGDYNGWKWTINGSSGSGQPFTIAVGTLPLLYPGGSTDYLDLSLTNPNSVTIYVSSLSVTLSSITTVSAGPNPCTTTDFTLTQFTSASTSNPIVLGAGQTRKLSQLGFSQAQMPSIKMLDRPLNQDRCKSATLNFTFGGSAQS